MFNKLNNVSTLIFLQFKLFMEQINVFEQTELLAGGVLNLNLNLLTNVSVIRFYR